MSSVASPKYVNQCCGEIGAQAPPAMVNVFRGRDTSISLRRERGGNQLGCTVLVILFAIFCYLVYRVVPIYLEKETFHGRLLNLAGQATIKGWDDRKVVNELLDVARRANFQVERESIQIHRIPGRPEVVLVVDYTRIEEFPGGYVYIFHFRSVAQGSLGI